MAKSKIDNETKTLAIAILEKQGVDPDDWLNERYSEVIASNSKILIECLKNSKN